MQHAGRRDWFNTRSANAATAADKARKIYLDVVALGWSGAVEKHKPKAAVSVTIATVGEVIDAVGRIAAIRANTLNAYAGSIRRLAAEIAGITTSDTTARFAYMRPEFKGYRSKVDALSVDILSAGAVAEWKARIVAAKKTPVEQKSAAISCDTVIRCAAALFGKKLRPILTKELTLPNPLPLAGLSYGRSSRRFRTNINPSRLFEQAREELAREHPEQFKALILCFLAGLRRKEADTLTWAQVDLDAGRISVRATDYFHPKSEEATRDIDLPLVAIDLFRAFKNGANDPVFVLRGGKAKPGVSYRYYRADASQQRGRTALHTWDRLLAWLTSKGIEDQKAIHALRKHAGSLIHATYGLEVAREFLGHRDIATTAGSYVDKRPRVTVVLEPLPARGGAS